MSDATEMFFFTRMRLEIVRVAAEATGLAGLTPVEREQMRAVAGIAALQLHRVVGAVDDADVRQAECDVEAIGRPVGRLLRAISDAAEFANHEAVEA